MRTKLHIPVEQYGFIEVEGEFSPPEAHQYYAEYKKYFTVNGWDKPRFLGEEKLENGHTYKAVQNEKTGKLYWLIDRM